MYIPRRKMKDNETECPVCDGDGEVMDGRRIHAMSMDPPMTNCPECGGSGYVREDDVDNIDLDKSLSDYEQDWRETAAEARFEQKRDGD